MLETTRIGIQIGLGFAIGIVLMTISGSLVTVQAHTMGARSEDARRLADTRRTVYCFLEAMVDQETGMRAFVATAKENFLDSLVAGRKQQTVAVADLRALSAGTAMLSVANSTSAQSAAVEQLSAAATELAGQMLHIKDTTATLSEQDASIIALLTRLRRRAADPASGPRPNTGIGQRHPGGAKLRSLIPRCGRTRIGTFYGAQDWI